jgi:hypothetical protein
LPKPKIGLGTSPNKNPGTGRPGKRWQKRSKQRHGRCTRLFFATVVLKNSNTKDKAPKQEEIGHQSKGKSATSLIQKNPEQEPVHNARIQRRRNTNLKKGSIVDAHIAKRTEQVHLLIARGGRVKISSFGAAPLLALCLLSNHPSRGVRLHNEEVKKKEVVHGERRVK